MQFWLHSEEGNFRLLDEPADLSIPLHFNGPQPNTYGVPHATAQAFEGGGFVGDTRRGGSCNFETYQLTPHCNGTHTECIGHIARARIAVRDTLTTSLFPAGLITVEPLPPQGDSYQPGPNPEDRIITRAMIEQKLKDLGECFGQALIIRTLPNGEDKKSRDYMAEAPAFFSNEAMQCIADSGVKHLLVDLPSVDRLFDEGKLSNHHIFWKVLQGSQEVDPVQHSLRTITEFIYVPNDLPDGKYVLDLQIAPFVADAAPSRPLLYKIAPESP